MADTTPVLGIQKPVFDGPADIRVVNTALDIIDANAGATNAAIDAATPMTTPGDLIVGGVAGAAGRLAVGTAGQVLTAVAGAPAWAQPTPMTAVGDLIRGGATGAAVRLPIGAETQALTVVGGVPAWTPPTYGGMTNPMTTPQDIIVGAAGGGAVRLGVGAEGQVLAVTGGVVGWSAPPAAQSLLVNGGFEVNQRGGTVTATNAYAHDRWQILLGSSSTMTVTDETVLVDTGSGHALKAVYVHSAASSVDQKIEDYLSLRGRTLTFAVRVRKGVANTARAYLADSGTKSYSASTTTTGAYETLVATRAIGAGATSVTVGVELAASDTVYLDNAVLVVGATAPAYAPLGPADEMDRCRRYYEVLGSGAFEEPFALGQVRSAAEIRWPLRYAEKAVTPTVVVSAAGHFGAWISDFSGATAFATLAAQNIGRAACLMVGGATFTGFVAGQASVIHTFNTAARIRVESNP